MRLLANSLSNGLRFVFRVLTMKLSCGNLKWRNKLLGRLVIIIIFS